MTDRTGRIVAGLLIAAPSLLAGCVERTVAISSDPPGAVVWLNDREIGRTPVEVEFIHYGTYDVRLELEGHEPVVTAAEASPPWWDTPGPDFFAELAPGEHPVRIEWNFRLEPADTDAAALRARAETFRQEARAGGEPES